MEESRSGSLRQAAAAAFPLTIPVFTGFLVLGMAYGVLMQTNGYGAFWSTLMSAVAFCGSMQFAAITLLTSAFDPVAALLLSIMVNARHLFYGISMLGKYKGLGRKRFFLIFGLCDETFSIASTAQPPEGVDRGSFYFFVTLFDYLYWVGGTLLGGSAGQRDPLQHRGTGLCAHSPVCSAVPGPAGERRQPDLRPDRYGLLTGGAAPGGSG